MRRATGRGGAALEDVVRVWMASPEAVLAALAEVFEGCCRGTSVK